MKLYRICHCRSSYIIHCSHTHYGETYCTPCCLVVIQMLFLVFFLSVSSLFLTALWVCILPSLHNTSFNFYSVGRKWGVRFLDFIYQQQEINHRRRIPRNIPPSEIFKSNTSWTKVRIRCYNLKIARMLQSFFKTCVTGLYFEFTCFFWLHTL